MRYVKDMTGRFSERPHYEPTELDALSEQILKEFFGGAIPLPIETDELTRLIERDTSDFDPGADLGLYGNDVEGVTEFWPGRKPRVRIAANLAYDEVRQNRYRTTLTHEYGHVNLHSYLFDINASSTDMFAAQSTNKKVQICKRDTILNARKTDWMEWQASYICGALLMSISHLRRIVCGYLEPRGLYGAVPPNGDDGEALVTLVRKEFRVSADAARVRLLQQGFLESRQQTASLFSRN